MLLIEYVGLKSLTGGHLGRHLEYFKTLNDARVASVGFINYDASITRIYKENSFKIKFQVILVFYQTIKLSVGITAIKTKQIRLSLLFPHKIDIPHPLLIALRYDSTESCQVNALLDSPV